MRLNRTVVASVAIAVLLAAVAPAVQAVPLAKPQTSQRLVASDWLDAALTWLGQFFEVRAPQPHAMQQKGTTKPPGGTSYPLGLGDGGFAGSCIDPNGCILGGP